MEITQRAKPEVDPVRLEKLNDEIGKKEEELARNRREYLGEKRVNQEILEILQSIPAKVMPGNSDIMMCQTKEGSQNTRELCTNWRESSQTEEILGMILRGNWRLAP